MRDRLTQFAREIYGKGQTYFEDYCGLSGGTISSSKRNGMSALNLARIASCCPELDLRWLLTGEGGMTAAARPAPFAGGNVTTIGDVSGMTASPVTVTVYGGRGDGCVVESLLEQNRLLTQQLAAQTDIIMELAGMRVK